MEFICARRYLSAKRNEKRRLIYARRRLHARISALRIKIKPSAEEERAERNGRGKEIRGGCSPGVAIRRDRSKKNKSLRFAE